jgi:methionine-S-sulfoxide reductase
VSTETAYFGAGCFWGVEETFRTLPGVAKTEVGYQGGHTVNPTYRDVCSHTTGHAEVVKVEFNPAEISYDRLLDVFFQEHNPTELNRQGPDVGDQYRSVVFVTNDEQRAAAMEAIKRHQPRFQKPIVTKVESLEPFFPAEDYHQQYLLKRGRASCHI